MSNLVVTQFVSLDGVAEDPGGSEDTPVGGWAFKFERGDDGDKFKLDEVMDSGALEGEFADKFNNMPKYVVSTTLSDPEWNNTTVIKDDIAGAVSKLKDEVEGDILVNGSMTLLKALMEDDLVDEYRLMVFPIVLGQGKRLFTDGGPESTLKLTDSKPVGPDGVIVLTYQKPSS
jgi:dihydrofolate reductase